MIAATKNKSNSIVILRVAIVTVDIYLKRSSFRLPRDLPLREYFGHSRLTELYTRPPAYIIFVNSPPLKSPFNFHAVAFERSSLFILSRGLIIISSRVSLNVAVFDRKASSGSVHSARVIRLNYLQEYRRCRPRRSLSVIIVVRVTSVRFE